MIRIVKKGIKQTNEGEEKDTDECHLSKNDDSASNCASYVAEASPIEELDQIFLSIRDKSSENRYPDHDEYTMHIKVFFHGTSSQVLQTTRVKLQLLYAIASQLACSNVVLCGVIYSIYSKMETLCFTDHYFRFENRTTLTGIRKKESPLPYDSVERKQMVLELPDMTIRAVLDYEVQSIIFKGEMFPEIIPNVIRVLLNRIRGVEFKETSTGREEIL